MYRKALFGPKVADVLTFYRNLFDGNKLLSHEGSVIVEHFPVNGGYWAAYGGGAGLFLCSEGSYRPEAATSEFELNYLKCLSGHRMLLQRVIDHVKDQNWFAVALEFVIVVAGVYVGLQAQEWQEGVANRERLDRIVAALRADLADARRVEATFWSDIEAGLGEFEKAYAKGENPPPFVYRITGSDTAPNLMWGSLQEAGIGALLDPELLFELSHFYSERAGIGVKVTRYMHSIESTVLPHIDGDPRFFYDASGEVMKPEYRATMERLREWGQYMSDLGPWSECLESRLTSASEPGESCQSFWYADSNE